MPRGMMQILALTREKSYLQSMLLLNGSNSPVPQIFIPIFSSESCGFQLICTFFWLNILRSSFLYYRDDQFCCSYLFINHFFYFLNTGSGMTNSNYTELNQLYEKYKNQGLCCKLKSFLKPTIPNNNFKFLCQVTCSRGKN